jgi:hypothetical protein
MNWTPLETLAKIEATWGKYNAEMRVLVLERLADKSPRYCRAMYAALADFHEGNWPPSRAELVKYHEEAGSRANDYADRIPAARQIEADTEPVVSPEIGKAKLAEILAGLGQKVVGK